MQQPLRSPLLYLMQSVEAQLQVSLISLADFFYSWSWRRRPGALQACVHSMSDAIVHLSTAIVCYQPSHTFVCWKLLVTCIFSGFQKQFLTADSQDWISLLAWKPGFTLAWCQRGPLWEEQQNWLLFCDVHATKTLEQMVDFVSLSPVLHLLLSPGTFDWLCKY